MEKLGWRIVPKYQTVAVIAVPAEGAIAFATMLYFLPSIARVRVKPVMAALAVEYCKLLELG